MHLTYGSFTMYSRRRGRLASVISSEAFWPRLAPSAADTNAQPSIPRPACMVAKETKTDGDAPAPACTSERGRLEEMPFP